MKRLIPLFIILFLSTYSFSQNQVDALRYSQLYPGGTARTVAMGGAFGALGGDFYSASQNPAGLGVYRGSELTITPELFLNTVSAKYNGSINKDRSLNLNLNNLGYVTAFNLDKKEGIVGGSFAFGYNKLANFRSNTHIEGNNQFTSLADMFIESANNGGEPFAPSELLPFTEGLFFDGEIMAIDNEGYYFLSNDIYDAVSESLNINQENIIERSGQINEWVFAAGFNYSHFLYFGASFSIMSVEYDENSTFKEYDGLNPNSQYFRFNETHSVSGAGFTGKFGVIVKPIKMLRIGAAYHLPVRYSLKDTYDATLRSAYVSQTVVPVNGKGEDLDVGIFDYEIITPGKAVGSLGIMLGKTMVISTDVEYIDYSSARFPLENLDSYDQIDYSEINGVIKEIYNNTVNVKAGIETRFDKLYLRGGFGYYGSPYKSGELNQDAVQYSYSGGIGFRSEGFFLDLALFYKMSEEKSVLYTHNIDSAPFPTASITSDGLKAMATFGFRF